MTDFGGARLYTVYAQQSASFPFGSDKMAAACVVSAPAGMARPGRLPPAATDPIKSVRPASGLGRVPPAERSPRWRRRARAVVVAAQAKQPSTGGSSGSGSASGGAGEGGGLTDAGSVKGPERRKTTRAYSINDKGGAGVTQDLVEGPRGEVLAGGEDLGGDLDATLLPATQNGRAGLGSRRTTRRKKGRNASKAAAVAQGTRQGKHSYDSFDEWDGTASFANARAVTDPSSEHMDDLFSYVGDWADQSELHVTMRQLERAADKGDAASALAALHRLVQAASSGEGDGRVPLAFYNSTLRACKRSRPPAHVEARRLLLEMREHGPAADARTYHEVIAALARAHEWRLAERTFAEMKREFPDARPSVRVYTSLISAYGKGGQWEKAKAAFDALLEDGTQVDTGVYNALLSAAVSAAQYREAARVFDRMPGDGVRRNVTTYNAVLTSLGRQRRLRDMQLTRNEMHKNHVEPNETTFSVLITAHGNAGDCRRACQLLDEACDSPWVYKSAVVFNSALGACVKAGESDLAQRVLRLMRREGIQPTLVTYNTLLMGASAERDWEEVADIFRELLRTGQIPDAITLDCMCGIEKLQAAADARAEAEAAAAKAVGGDGGDDFEADEVVDAAGEANEEGAGEAGSVGKDLGNLPELLVQIVEEELANHSGGSEGKEPEKGGDENGDGRRRTRGPTASSSSYGGGGLPPLAPGATATHAYDALLRALHVNGKGQAVEATFSEMLDKGVRRTVHTYNSLIASYEARRQWERAGDAMARMQEEGIAPDALTFDALIDVCEEMGQWDRATAWLEQAQEQGHLRCEDELGVLDLHRIRSAGTAQTVLRWWLRRMRSRALAPLDVRAAGQGTRAILESTVSGKKVPKEQDAAGASSAIPVQIRDLPEQIQVVTGWGKHSTVFGYSPVKERVIALLGGLNSPFDVPDHNIGCVVAHRGEVRAWLVRDELLSLVRFLGGNKEALRRNFNPRSVGLPVVGGGLRAER